MVALAVKVIEVIGESDKSWDDAAKEAFESAAKTIRNIVGIDVKDMTAKVENNKIVKFKTSVKIAFVVE